MRPTMRVCAATVIVWLWVGLPLARAEINYSPENNGIEISVYPDEAPATMDTLLAADRKCGWGVVQYDPATDTYTIQASLLIGNDQDLGTYVQIGRPDHPREIVVVCGNVWIKPARKSVKRSDGKPAIQNRLILGNATNAAIQAALKIACSKPEEYGLFLGRRTMGQETVPVSDGAAISIFNSTLTAAVPDKEHWLRGTGAWQGVHTGWYGEDIELVNARISWIGGAEMLYGVQAHNSVIRGCVFEHGVQLFVGGNHTAFNCTFRHLPVAAVGEAIRMIRCRFENLGVAMVGRKVELIGCVLTNNVRNVQISDGSDYRLIDCQVGPPKEWGLFKGHGRYTEWESVVFQVTDARDRLVPEVIVNVACPENYQAVENGLVFTDAQGLTPSDPEKGAVRVIRRRLEVPSGGVPTQPRTYSYAYEVTAHAPGFLKSRVVLPGIQPIARPVKLILKRPGGCGCRGK